MKHGAFKIFAVSLLIFSMLGAVSADVQPLVKRFDPKVEQSEAGFLDGMYRCYAYEPNFIWLAWVPFPENQSYQTANQWCIETNGGRM